MGGVGVWVKRWLDAKEDGVLDAKDGEGMTKEVDKSGVGVRRDEAVGEKEVSNIGDWEEDAVCIAEVRFGMMAVLGDGTEVVVPGDDAVMVLDDADEKMLGKLDEMGLGMLGVTGIDEYTD